MLHIIVAYNVLLFRSETFVPLLHLVKVIIVKIFVSPLVLIAHVMMDTMERDARKVFYKTRHLSMLGAK